MAQLVHETKCGYADVASKFGVKITLVQTIMSKVKSDPDWLTGLLRAAVAKQRRQSEIKRTIKEHVDSGQNIWNAGQIANTIYQTFDWKPPESEIRESLKSDFGMSYKKIKRVPFQGNTDRCLVLRHIYAKEVLRLLSEGKRLINIDETWLTETDFRRRKWRKRGTTNSLPVKAMNQRVSLIAAVDTDGEIILSLTQVNTDSDVLSMFLVHLARKLTKADPRWKENCFCILDGAAYHRSAETQTTMK